MKSNDYKRWTFEDNQLLIEWFNARKPIGIIAAALGRKPTAAWSQLHKLGYVADFRLPPNVQLTYPEFEVVNFPPPPPVPPSEHFDDEDDYEPEDYYIPSEPKLYPPPPPPPPPPAP